ncbi:MAG: hypothetical protein WKF37_23005 [Bryobacteraceae bacterium]
MQLPTSKQTTSILTLNLVCEKEQPIRKPNKERLHTALMMLMIAKERCNQNRRQKMPSTIAARHALFTLLTSLVKDSIAAI